jgi:hypothetical protein
VVCIEDLFVDLPMLSRSRRKDGEVSTKLVHISVVMN